jgi:hypothetical protein
MPPAMARSGCSTSAARSSAISRKSWRVNSLSPVEIGTAEARRTSARPILSPAVTGSSNHSRSQSSTMRQKALASATVQVPCASAISLMSGPSARRAARTRAAERATDPSMLPTRIFTARKPPFSQ